MSGHKIFTDAFFAAAIFTASATQLAGLPEACCFIASGLVGGAVSLAVYISRCRSPERTRP